jgi:crotonobetainyl-CoA:carnitine CoA-transferase CaiB-like acyl-CoA transferase
VRIDRRPLPVGMAPRLGEHTAQVLRELGIDA